MKRKVNVGLFVIVIIVLLGWLVIEWRGFVAPAPMGIHGTYSLPGTKNPTFVASISKDSLLENFRKAGLNVRSGRLNSYDPPWDSLRYIIGNIPCGSERIEAYIEFSDSVKTQSSFFVLWINASPTNDDSKYDQLAFHYHGCLEDVLKQQSVTKSVDSTFGSH